MEFTTSQFHHSSPPQRWLRGAQVAQRGDGAAAAQRLDEGLGRTPGTASGWVGVDCHGIHMAVMGWVSAKCHGKPPDILESENHLEMIHCHSGFSSLPCWFTRG